MAGLPRGRGSRILCGLAIGTAQIALLLVAAAPLDQPLAAVALSVHVQGNHLVNGTGATIRLIGVDYSGPEYACAQGWGIFDGPSSLTSVQAIKAWHVNAVRLPLNEDCWLGINGVKSSYGGSNYRSAILKYVNLLTGDGMYAILALAWNAPGTKLATGQNPMPDYSHSSAFWKSVASTFKGHPAVLLDLFGEPFPADNSNTTAAWTCWKNGGACAGVSYRTVGMQSLVNTVRATGARNVVMLGGVQYANNLSHWLAYKPKDSTGQLAASAHIYGNNACGAQNGGSCLTNTVAPVAAKVPVVFGETGETYDDSECSSRNMQVILPWADQHGVSYLAWTWDTWGTCSALISNFNGTVNTQTPPGAAYAEYVHNHFAAVASK
jgi:hypothetical protein